jgi:glycosyltransferase involved in cell wall biosynthesis
MIAPTPFFSHRGTHIRILEEARALERLGHSITIVTYHIGDDIGKYIDTTITVRRIRRWLFWYKKTEAGPDWQKVILNMFLIKKTFSLIRTWQPDVIHAHLHEGVIIARIMQWIFFWKKIPVVADFHGSLVGEMRSHGYLGALPIGTIFRALERWINGMGDAAIVSGEENVAMIAKARKDAHARHICDGVNMHAYDRSVDRGALRERHHIAINAFVIVYTGALIANKGIDHVLHSIRSVIQKIPSAHFVIGGYPDQWVRQYVSAHQLDDHVTIISPLNYFSLPEVNMLGDVAIDPKDASVQQASGKILQYMAAHVGIICADRPTNRMYLNHDSAQFLPLVTADTLVTAIEKFHDDRAYLHRSADSAYRDAMRFSWDEIGTEIENIYQSVIHMKKKM